MTPMANVSPPIISYAKPATQASSSDTRTEIFLPQKPKAPYVHPKFNNFCRTVNGYVDGEKHNFSSLIDVTKAAWFMYLPFQVAGLFNERMNKLAKAWYGVGWSIVYSCLRPFKENRETLVDRSDKPEGKVHDFWKSLYNANEHFRVGMGSFVTSIYGSGALGMMWGAVTGNDEFFDKSADVYKTGMFNQDQVFSSMNFSTVLKRSLNPDQLDEIDKKKDNVKSGVELVDSVLFIPTIVTRALDTAKLFFGTQLSEGVQRFTNALAYFKYGTWATRFGIMKGGDKKEGGDLESLEDSNKPLFYTQKYGAKAFCWTLPTLSWISSACELFGAREMAEKVFNLEGILERLNPTIASWCLTNPWLQGYFGAMKHEEVPGATSVHA